MISWICDLHQTAGCGTFNCVVCDPMPMMAFGQNYKIMILHSILLEQEACYES